MDYFKEKQFFFVSNAPGLNAKTFSVVNISGEERISAPYRFEATLVSNQANLDMDAILANAAMLYLKPDKKLPIHGVLAGFEQLHQVDDNVFYRALLVPTVWKLTLYEGSQVFLQMSVPDIIEQVLTKTGTGGSSGILTSNDYKLKLTRSYKKWSYICQYQENNLSFISRWMEREGIYYYFEQGDQKEQLVITDTYLSHVEIAGLNSVHYSPPSSLDANAQDEVATAFIMRQKPMPKKVILQDFNYRKSPPVISGEAVVSPNGSGEIYLYGEHVKDVDEANACAKIRAEEISCRQKVFHGESTVPALQTGYLFALDRHYRKDLNAKYLLTGILHEGSQAALLISDLDKAGLRDDRTYYHNSFDAIPSGAQFRPERNTPKPRFFGTMNAKVEAEGNGQYAEIDPYGRYKIKLPFDRSDKAGQKASRWIRMAQPYAGPNEGMHFPLRKGAEVLLTFIDGDPDRPVIAGAIPNAENPNRIIDKTATKNVIHTSGGNKLEFQDRDGKQSVIMSSPHKNTRIHIGAPNSPDNTLDIFSEGSGHLQTLQDILIEGGSVSHDQYFPEDFYSDDPDGFFKNPDNGHILLMTQGCLKSYTGDSSVELFSNTQSTLTGFGPVIQKFKTDPDVQNAFATNDREKLKKVLSDKLDGVIGASDAPAKQTYILGNVSEEIHGFQTLSLSKDQTINVSGNQNTTVTKTQNVEVDVNQEIRVKGKQKLRVGSSPNDGEEDCFIGVDGDMKIDVKKKFELDAEEYSIHDGSKIHFNHGVDWDIYAGLKVDTNLGFAIELNPAMQLALTLFSAEFYAFYIHIAAVKKENEGITFSEFGAKVSNAAAAIKNHFTVHNPPVPPAPPEEIEMDQIVSGGFVWV